MVVDVRSSPMASRHPKPPEGYLRPMITSHLVVIYALTDALTILGSLLATRLFLDPSLSMERHLPMGLGGVMLFLVIAWRHGLYRSWRVTPIRVEIFWIAVCWTLAISILTLFVILLGYDISRETNPTALTWYLVAAITLCLQRGLVRTGFHFIRMSGRNYRRIAILGATPVAQRLSSAISSSAWLGLRMHGIYDDRSTRIEAMPVAGSMQDLLQAARAGEVDTIYITIPIYAVERIRGKISALMDTTASVYLVPDFLMYGLIESRLSYFDDIPTVTVSESPFVGIEGWTKRLEDVALSLLILPLIVLPMLLIAIGIKLSSQGPVFFRQTRYGLDGRPVRVWKFRSMTAEASASGQFRQAQRNDSRVTPFGAFLRRTSLDELPQIMNVIEGSMSLVGPRPHPTELNESFRMIIPGYMQRHKVKPGITGWAQINGWRGETDTLEKMQRRVEYDLDYIRRWSLWLDMKILALTAIRGFRGPNAY